jgi:DedD protein
MPFFKSRKGGDESAAAARQPESIEAMRKRARHRLIGAGVLVLIGVIGFPLLFDTQPRPIAVDIPIEIPDRNKVKPLPVPAQPVAQPPAVSAPVAPPPAPEKAAEAPAKAETKPEAGSEPKPKPESRLEPKPEPKSEPKIAAKSATPAEDAPRAKDLLDGKPAKVAAVEGRFVVQVGAFADVGKARDARQKVERAGLKTYTNVTETKDGKRIRVRVGPFANRAEADKAADKIKGLDLPAAILTL